MRALRWNAAVKNNLGTSKVNHITTDGRNKKPVGAKYSLGRYKNTHAGNGYNVRRNFFAPNKTERENHRYSLKHLPFQIVAESSMVII